MLTRKAVLAMTAAAGIATVPVLAFGQANTGGSSMMPQTTQTTPQTGPTHGITTTPQGRQSGTSEQNPRLPGAAGPAQGQAPAGGGATAAGNPSGAGTGPGIGTSGGTATAPGAPADATRGGGGGSGAATTTPGTGGAAATPGATGGANVTVTTPPAATGGTAATTGGTAAARDGTPGNPPSTMTGRAVDRLQGETPRPDGTPGNPPGTALGRAVGATDTPGAATTAATGAAATTGAAAAGTMAVDAAALRDGRRASKVIGSTVYGEGNESIGSVDDILFAGPSGQHPPVAVLSVGGFLGIGAKLVAVGYDRLRYDAQRERWVLPGATKEALTSLPTFAYDGDRARDASATGTDRPATNSRAGGGGGATAPAAPAATAPQRNQ